MLKLFAEKKCRAGAFSADKWRYMLFTVSHPADGYYWLRHDDSKGSVPLAILLTVLLSFSYTANRLLASFVVNDTDPRGVDTFYELLGVMAFYFLICISNWSVTCLMNGEGRLRDILIAIGYGSFPITVMMLAGTVISCLIADDEEAFYAIVIGVGIVYGAVMMLIGIMQVHNYTLGKTLLTLLLTFTAMLVLIFLIMLLGNLLGMVFNFFRSVYTEIIFRA